MSKRQKHQKAEKTQKESNELAEDQLETVSGGIIAVLQQEQVTDKWIPAHTVDKASPVLFTACATGQHIKEV